MAQTININWLLSNDSPTSKTFVGQADVGGSGSFSIDVQINLPVEIDAFGAASLFVQPVGNFPDFPAVDGFATRILSVDLTNQTAVIHITRVDAESGWAMDLRLNLLLIDQKTF